MTKNPLIRKVPRTTNFKNENKSKGILDDFAVRKNIATREGTIEKVPVNDSDIANKKYVDDNVQGSVGSDGDIQYASTSPAFGSSSNLNYDLANKKLYVNQNLEVKGTSTTSPTLSLSGNSAFSTPFNVYGWPSSNTFGLLDNMGTGHGGLSMRGISLVRAGGSLVGGVGVLGIIGTQSTTTAAVLFRAGRITSNTYTSLTDNYLAYVFGSHGGSPYLKIYPNKSSFNADLDVVGDLTAGTINADDGFTGTGAYTNFTIVGGIITAAS